MGTLIKSNLTQRDAGAVSSLAKRNPAFLTSSGILSPSSYTKYLLKRIYYLLGQDKKNRLFVSNQGASSGIALLRFMEWDSNFFKTPIGCIEHILTDESQKGKEIYRIEKELLRSGMDFARRIGIRILYISVCSTKHRLINLLNYLRFNFICSEIEGVIQRKNVPYLYAKEKIDSIYKFRKYKREDMPQIMKIGEEITKDVKSKFSLNLYLPLKERKKYYLESIKNCCLGLNADDLFVAVKNHNVVGFASYRYDRDFRKALGKQMSFLVMGGISRLERRKNIGMHLFTWAHKQIFKESGLILWKAYLHNLPMIRFILSRDFLPPFNFIYNFCKRI